MTQPVSPPTFEEPHAAGQPPPELGGFRVSGPAGQRDGGTFVYDAAGKDGEAVTLHVTAAAVGSRRAKARFRRLARERARLDHSACLAVKAFGEARGRLYFASEPLPARSLSDLLRDGPMEPARAVRILSAAAAALDAGRERGLVHLALSPESVLLDDERVLLDLFGILGATATAGIGDVAPRGTHVHYKPPEVVRGEEPRPPSNVYSLTAMLVHALTGTPPFEHRDPVLIEYAHVSEPRPRPSRRRAGLPAGLDGLIASGMAKEPWRRPATATLLMKEAERILLGGGGAATLPGGSSSSNGHGGPRPLPATGPAPVADRPSTVSPVLEAWIAAGSIASPSSAPRAADSPHAQGVPALGPPAPPLAPSPLAHASPAGAMAPPTHTPRPAAPAAPPPPTRIAPPLVARVRALAPLAAAVLVAAALGALIGLPGSAPEERPVAARSPDARPLERFDAVRMRLRDDLALAAGAEEQARLADRLAVAHGQLATRARSATIDAAAERGSGAYAELADAARAGDADAFDAAAAEVEAAEVALERALRSPG